jgi:hypothetical protein
MCHTFLTLQPPPHILPRYKGSSTAESYQLAAGYEVCGRNLSLLNASYGYHAACLFSNFNFFQRPRRSFAQEESSPAPAIPASGRCMHRSSITPLDIFLRFSDPFKIETPSAPLCSRAAARELPAAALKALQTHAICAPLLGIASPRGKVCGCRLSRDLSLMVVGLCEQASCAAAGECVANTCACVGISACRAHDDAHCLSRACGCGAWKDVARTCCTTPLLHDNNLQGPICLNTCLALLSHLSALLSGPAAGIVDIVRSSLTAGPATLRQLAALRLPSVRQAVSRLLLFFICLPTLL